MKILVAEHSGFCYGVKRAVKILDDLVLAKENIYTLGPIIHNDQVTAYYEAQGVKIIETLSDIHASEISDIGVVIRSHGAPKSVYDEAEHKQLKIYDATCPYVKKIQNKVSTYASKGYNIIIVGNASHPEVIGINGWCDYQALIIDHVDQVKLLKLSTGPICVVAQTTFNMKKWDEISDALNARFSDIRVYNTICLATEQRQNACTDLAKKVDYMIVVGGKHSSNTIKLAEICSKYVPTTHIETKDDLNGDELIGKKVVGITAGASTPDWIIQSIILKIENEGEVFF
jgi:4-hydroxy-3-methylbut-2-enyl diphosphate reductase